jgi:hypothetical protein
MNESTRRNSVTGLAANVRDDGHDVAGLMLARTRPGGPPRTPFAAWPGPAKSGALGGGWEPRVTIPGPLRAEPTHN